MFAAFFGCANIYDNTSPGAMYENDAYICPYDVDLVLHTRTIRILFETCRGTADLLPYALLLHSLYTLGGEINIRKMIEPQKVRR